MKLLWDKEHVMDEPRLTAGERRWLLKALRETQDVRVYQRALAVLERDRGKTAAEIANVLHVSRRSVYHWVEYFQRNRDGRALNDAPRSGRPPRWVENAEKALLGLLAQEPIRQGYVATQWTVPLLQASLWQQTGERYSDSTIRRALHRSGFVWKRSRYRLAADSEREKKTAHSARGWRLAGALHVARSGRNGRVAVSAAAGSVVAARRTGGCDVERSQ
jgi:transposase